MKTEKAKSKKRRKRRRKRAVKEETGKSEKEEGGKDEGEHRASLHKAENKGCRHGPLSLIVSKGRSRMRPF